MSVRTLPEYCKDGALWEYQKFDPEVRIKWRGWGWGYWFRRCRMDWWETPENGNFSRRTGWLEFGPVFVWYTSGEIVVRRVND